MVLVLDPILRNRFCSLDQSTRPAVRGRKWVLPSATLSITSTIALSTSTIVLTNAGLTTCATLMSSHDRALATFQTSSFNGQRVVGRRGEIGYTAIPLQLANEVKVLSDFSRDVDLLSTVY